ncbi:glycosyltransferase [Kutzneria sp. CA-103260]|uniref:glycosyltransferase n=1 Tax=Kutzneria sp. CA-103260 TaxID=2802641 RepID=UPI001BA8EE26|nr:glycosyltransferase [Kutzneria sp. CA-103260]QUQ71354.1 glycosyltransferase [Kutzneria sp. CA-103260]
MSTVVIAALGTQGDVAPFCGLGPRLRRAGHRVVIAAQAPYADLVANAGLEFRPLPGDPEAGAQSEEFQQYFDKGHSRRTRKGIIPTLVEGLREVGPALVEATEDADLLLTGFGAALPAYHVGLGLGIPTAGLFLLPTAPTGDFPPAPLPMPSLGRWGNRLVHTIAMQGERIFLAGLNDLRRDLGLAPTSLSAIRREQHEQRWPILYGFSQHVVARPSDWRPGLDIAGYWWPPLQPDWEPTAELRDFLDSGEPPVYFGYGSGALSRSDRLIELTVAAARKAGVRAVVSGLPVSGDDVLGIGNVDFDWLFPQMATLVHHGGAGTTAAGLWAGVPAVTTPVIVDQHFWGRRLVQLGASPASIRLPKLTVDRLAAAIRAAIDNPSYRTRSRQLRDQIQDEDGGAPVLDLVDRLVHRGQPVHRPTSHKII